MISILVVASTKTMLPSVDSQGGRGFVIRLARALSCHCETAHRGRKASLGGGEWIKLGYFLRPYARAVRILPKTNRIERKPIPRTNVTAIIPIEKAFIFLLLKNLIFDPFQTKNPW